MESIVSVRENKTTLFASSKNYIVATVFLSLFAIVGIRALRRTIEIILVSGEIAESLFPTLVGTMYDEVSKVTCWHLPY